jgi:anti-sigma factor (TIGR02949 family)
MRAFALLSKFQKKLKMHSPVPAPKVGLQREGSPYSDAECDDIISKLEQLLDNELDAGKREEFIEKVNSCEYCLEQYKIEKSIRSMIKSGFKNIMVSANLIKNIKSSIQQTRGTTSLEVGTRAKSA